jgi:hypothetical protein
LSSTAFTQRSQVAVSWFVARSNWAAARLRATPRLLAAEKVLYQSVCASSSDWIRRATARRAEPGTAAS